MPMGGAVSGRSQTLADSTSKCLPRYVYRIARPQGPDDLDGLLEHLVAQSGKRPPPPDNVLIEVLARAEPEGEPPVGQQLHGRRLLRDDGGVISADRAGDIRHERNPLGRLSSRAEHAPRVRGMAL